MPVSRFADASISDELRQILVCFNPLSIYLMSNLTHFFSFWNCVDKDLLVAGSLGHFDRKCASFPAVMSGCPIRTGIIIMMFSQDMVRMIGV
jgi:hypothetical protein